MDQIIPTFDGYNLESVDACGNGFCAITCTVAGIQGIIQEEHFDGYDGSYPVHHGFPNRPWVMSGTIIRNNQADLASYIARFESYTDADFSPPTDASSWKVLTDSFGNIWPQARIRTVTPVDPHAFDGDRFGCSIIITGVLYGSPVFNA